MLLLFLSALCQAGSVEVVGASLDGHAWATRYSESTTDGHDGSCNYPKMGDGRQPTYVKLFLCTEESGCPALDGSGWTVYDRGCTEHEDAVVQLNAAKAAYLENGVTLGLNADPLPKSSRGWSVSTDQMAKVGLAAEASLRAMQKGDEWRVRATSEGYGTITAWTGESEPSQLHLLPDGTLLVFAGSELSVSQVPLKRVAARLVNDRGFSFYKEKNYGMALVDFQRTTVIDAEFGQGAFNWACVEALMGNTDQAIAALEKAIAAQPKTFIAKAKKDSDLDSIRSDPRFQSLVK